VVVEAEETVMMIGLGTLIPFGAGTVYNDATGRYEIVGQSGSYGNLQDLQNALYRPEIALLASQTPTEHGTMLTPAYPGMVYYPEQRFYTLPGGQQIPEATYQQAVAAGTVAELIHQYTAYGTERAPGTATVFTVPVTTPVSVSLPAAIAAYGTAAPTATVLATSTAKDASDAAAKATADAAAKVAADAAVAAAKKVAANGGATAGFDLTKFLKDNQTLLLIGAAGLGALLLFSKRKGVG
jgi:hypothetical protein